MHQMLPWGRCHAISCAACRAVRSCCMWHDITSYALSNYTVRSVVMSWSYLNIVVLTWHHTTRYDIVWHLMLHYERIIYELWDASCDMQENRWHDIAYAPFCDYISRCIATLLWHAMSWYGVICFDAACHTSWDHRRQDSEAHLQLVSLCAVSWIKPSQPCGIVGATSLDPSDVFFQHKLGFPTPSSCDHSCSSDCSYMTDGKQGPAETLCGQSPYQSLPDYMRLHRSSSILAIPSYSGGYLFYDFASIILVRGLILVLTSCTFLLFKG